MRILVILIAVLMGGWLTFDGMRALTRGDYVTRDGQIGPWSRVVSAMGLNPRGVGVKIAHVVLGLFWLGCVALFAARIPLGWYGLVACSILTLWYLPLGTVLSIVEILLLTLPLLRR